MKKTKGGLKKPGRWAKVRKVMSDLALVLKLIALLKDYAYIWEWIKPLLDVL